MSIMVDVEEGCPSGNGAGLLTRGRSQGRAGSIPAPSAETVRKPCANPHCDRVVPLNWTYCKDRRCQSTRGSPEYRAWMQERYRVEQQRVRIRNSSPEAKERRARWKADHPDLVAAQQRRRQIRLTKIRRQHQLRMDKVRRANAVFRNREMEKALAEASGELRALIEEQRRDTDRIRRTPSDPWLLTTLDAPLPGHEHLTIGDLLSKDSGLLASKWADPTGEAVTYLIEQEEEVAEWDLLTQGENQ